MEQQTTVVIVGAGPAGLATSACLNLQNVPNIVLEREDCYASLWQKRAYGRLKLHLAKEFCELPHMSFPSNAPTYVPKQGFINYLHDYVSNFNIKPLYQRAVISASFVQKDEKWVVMVENTMSGTRETYVARFLVVATGENSEGYVPPIPGLDSFNGEVMHSSRYKNGNNFEKKRVLVVGSGNSGMEIALDLSNWGADTSIVIRNPVHVVNEQIMRLGMTLLKYLPINMVDNLIVALSKMKYGDLSGYGIIRPSKGPLYLKKETGRSSVLDVGTIDKIQANEIQVVPSIKEVTGNDVYFNNGQIKSFDAILLATGYKSTVWKWLEDDGGLFGNDGMPRNSAPNHWKGERGLYCVGFARAGLFGISNDAKVIANDVISNLNNHH